ncbi:hypothetical protein [Cryptosporangium phraense]|uniref:Serine/threonine protein kinase n=1 Tax=Cryptosporangium phraense TaxID=2593070 RepID=A0A545AWE5_9ACTN|nr:hypothetical protein [Cryptosporangium phraense]TQS45647.1 hypothetical protein FL583_07940 [Cryptosporangium phraense]
MIAAIALGVAVLSLIVAGLALARSGGNGDSDVVAQPLPSSAPAPAEPSSAVSVAPVPSGENSPLDPGQLDPSSTYQSAYENQTLTVQSGGDFVHIDVDEPRVRPENGGDVTYVAGGGNGTLNFQDADRVAPVQSAQSSAGDCVEAIRSSASVSSMASAANLTVCVLTSRANASSEGITQKIVRFHVDSIARDNDTLTVSLTPWNVP